MVSYFSGGGEPLVRMERSNTENDRLDRGKYPGKSVADADVGSDRIFALLLFEAFSQNHGNDDQELCFGQASRACGARAAGHGRADYRHCRKVRIFFAGGSNESFLGGIRVHTCVLSERSRSDPASHTAGRFVARTLPKPKRRNHDEQNCFDRSARKNRIYPCP